MSLFPALPFHAELKQPISSHPPIELTRSATEFLVWFSFIPQAPTLFALVVCVTEVFTFLGTLFSAQQELSGIPWGREASQDNVCGQIFPRMAVPEESLVCYLQSAPTQRLPAEEPFLHRFVGAGRPSDVKLFSAKVTSSNQLNLWQLLVSLSFLAKCGLQKRNQLELSPQEQQQQRARIWVMFSAL